MAKPVSNPLTLVMTAKSAEDYAKLKALVESIQALPRDKSPISIALNKIGTVHFARFVFLNDSQLAIITTYDGDFEEYIDAFTNEIGPVFDKLFAFVQGAPPAPVSDYRTEFRDFVLANDKKAVGDFYSAYPDLKVGDILTMQRNQAKGS